MKKMYKKKYFTIAGICILMSFANATNANAQDFNLLNKVVASDRDSNVYFGRSVAISGNYAIVGAQEDDWNGNGGDSIYDAGAAYIYAKSANGAWIEMQKLVASDRDLEEEYFGASVAISGNYAIVGAYYSGGDTIGANPPNYIHRAGSAYIFERNTTTNKWEEKQKIVASDRSFFDLFGSAVAISGNYAVVGAEAVDFSGINNAGAAYVFERDNANNNWSEVTKIVAPKLVENIHFGFSVAIAGDWIAVGAYRDDWDENGLDSIDEAGSVSTFKRDPSANPIWSFDQKLVASDRDTSSKFGVSVAINGDILLIGADFEDFADTLGTAEMNNSGAAYVFEYKSTAWAQTQKIVPLGRATNDRFGTSVAIFGNLALVGSIGSNYDENWKNYINRAGAAYFFRKNGTGTWNQTQRIVSKHRHRAGDFGVSVGLSDSVAIIGAYREVLDSIGNTPLTEAGAAYVFEVCNSNVTIDNSTTLLNNGIKVNDTISKLSTFYQWIDCNDNDALIPGATNHTFHPAQDGDYAVIIQKNACLDTSACVNIAITGISEEQDGNSVSIYPNPANEQLFIDLKNIKATKLTLIDITGKEVYSSDITGKKKVSISLTNYDNGIYFVTISSKNENMAFKIAVSHE